MIIIIVLPLQCMYANPIACLVYDRHTICCIYIYFLFIYLFKVGML